MSYAEFLHRKSQLGGDHGLKPLFKADFLFDFQQFLYEWSAVKGRAAALTDCGTGKGQPYGTGVLTPRGFVQNHTLNLGDSVIASDGIAYPLLGKYDRGRQPVYRVWFSDGANFIVDESHLHIVRTNNDRQRGRPWRVLSTRKLLDSSLRYGAGGKSRSFDIPTVAPIQFDDEHHWIHPYIVGVLLGDGCLTKHCTVTLADAQILDTVRALLPAGWTLTKKKTAKYDYKISRGGMNDRAFVAELRRLGLYGKRSNTKFIPLEYLIDSVGNRVWLLRGLMDTDGYIGSSSHLYSTSHQLILDARFLIQSLGGIPTQSVKRTSCVHKGTRREGQPCHILTFSLKTFNPFHLERKARRWNSKPRDNGRWISRIEPLGRERTLCLSVGSPDQSYVTEHFIVTHNTPIQLSWAQNVLQQTNRPVLIMAPLAVGPQTMREGEKFGIEVRRCADGKLSGPAIYVTNYERLHLFNADDFDGVVCDESSAIKHFSGARQKEVTHFLSKRPYRLLCTATAAPNDFIELGTSSEALGQLGRMDMLSQFFKNDENSLHPIWWGARWRIKKHAEHEFWRWVCSWARAMRKPSDLGFDDGRFQLPPLNVTQHVIENTDPLPGFLFKLPAVTLDEQRAERRATIQQRCERVMELCAPHETSVIWCHLNEEGDLLERMVDGAVQVSGADPDERKEEIFLDFAEGNIKALVTKPSIGAFGLNWQHCAHMSFFPSHSFEQYYQGVRRCWRFGQTNPVQVDVVTTEGERGVLLNLQRKSVQADEMFSRLVQHMNNELAIARPAEPIPTVEVPAWI